MVSNEKNILHYSITYSLKKSWIKHTGVRYNVLQWAAHTSMADNQTVYHRKKSL